MARQPVEITTTLPMEDVAALFQRAMRVSWWSEFRGAGTQFEEPRGSVFDRLSGDQPDFVVMAVLGGGGTEIQKSAVHMNMWDRGSHREIMLGVGKALGAFGVKANRKIRRFVNALAAEDGSLRYTGI
ncbi:hypothetical protein [Actinacidiphila epipremni]|jgi:hypothetical protein|uniref:Uncharacterized protein n=1 Tax=Actinacidiphila epipremni TaxID=2053013 RepID=A0ABX0ZM29_9ACTN|nr:hypothetical protein [Actinacidiphila epipremni]NJP44132.1 hypothetical protein [Actinacidiphila epipremni]